VGNLVFKAFEARPRPQLNWIRKAEIYIITGDFVRGGCNMSCSFAVVDGVGWMARVEKEGRVSKVR
jgi:hypothetical protein